MSDVMRQPHAFAFSTGRPRIRNMTEVLPMRTDGRSRGPLQQILSYLPKEVQAEAKNRVAQSAGTPVALSEILPRAEPVVIPEKTDRNESSGIVEKRVGKSLSEPKPSQTPKVHYENGITRKSGRTGESDSPKPATPKETAAARIIRHYNLKGPGKTLCVSVTKRFIYPEEDTDYEFVLVIKKADLETPEQVISYMLLQELIGSGLKRITSEVYLLKSGKPGQYALRNTKGTSEAYICKYEAEHSGHSGCFAAGYPYFLCGFSAETPQKLLAKGKMSDVPFVISRSYSGLCDKLFGIQTSGNNRQYPAESSPNKLSVNELNAQYLEKIKPETNEYRKVSSAAKKLPEGQKIRLSEIEKCKNCGPCSRHGTGERLEGLGIFLCAEENRNRVVFLEAPCDACIQNVASEIRSLSEHVRRERPSSLSPVNDRKSNSMRKYYNQRFCLLSKFSDAVKLSQEAWFSICPEAIAKHIARRICQLSEELKRPIRVMDPFCGSGGNIIHLAAMSEVEKAFGYDIEPREIECAEKIAKLYGVEEKVQFAVCDFFKLAHKGEVDAIVFSPPWGGPDYLNGGIYDITNMPVDYLDVVERCQNFTKNLAVLLPRNVCLDQLLNLDRKRRGFESQLRVEIEVNFSNDRPKTVTAYYGELVNTI